MKVESQKSKVKILKRNNFTPLQKEKNQYSPSRTHEDDTLPEIELVANSFEPSFSISVSHKAFDNSVEYKTKKSEYSSC